MIQNTYYNEKWENLEMYQRLIQYWSIMFDTREEISVLDNMNFNIHLFPEIITRKEMADLYPIEPGYTSPDGYTEMQEVIRNLELARLRYSATSQEKLDKKSIVEQAGLGCGNGCTNVMSGVINSIIKLKREEEKIQQPEVVLILPNYTVYAAQLSNLAGAVTPRYVHTKRENNFLPTSEEIAAVITPKTAAIVITYPNNPAQSTYEGEQVSELQKIVEICQKKEIFLVVDNIYQDLIFPKERKFAEIFNLTDHLDYVIKVYGCSKDTPFYSGYRTGYWFGDPRISEKYKYMISSSENSMNTQSLVYFALNLYFKYKMLIQEQPKLKDMCLFSQGLFGWSQPVIKNELFQKMDELNLYAKYQERVQISDSIQENALKKMSAFLSQSKVFSDYVNQQIGNVFFIKLNPKFHQGNDDVFFKKIFDEINCGVLPGNVFGIPRHMNETWFRITLIHDSVDTIIQSLEEIEKLYVGKNQYN